MWHQYAASPTSINQADVSCLAASVRCGAAGSAQSLFVRGSAKSFVDDPCISRGAVRGRAAALLRSSETQPLDCMICPLEMGISCTTVCVCACTRPPPPPQQPQPQRLSSGAPAATLGLLREEGSGVVVGAPLGNRFFRSRISKSHYGVDARDPLSLFWLCAHSAP